jgi:hypothetical protein
MNQPQLIIVTYKPKNGKTAELDTLVQKHFPMLKEFGLTTDRQPFIGRSTDGTLVEVFEWVSLEASKTAHENPTIGKMWEAMGNVCEFTTLGELPEAQTPFPHFPKAF